MCMIVASLCECAGDGRVDDLTGRDKFWGEKGRSSEGAVAWITLHMGTIRECHDMMQIVSFLRKDNVPTRIRAQSCIDNTTLEALAFYNRDKSLYTFVTEICPQENMHERQRCLLLPVGMPHHGVFRMHQLDTFYNALNSNDQDSLNSAAGGNFLDKMPRECLKIIESKSKVCQSRSKAVVAKVSTSSSTPAVSSDVAELKDMVRAFDFSIKKPNFQLPRSQVKAGIPFLRMARALIDVHDELMTLRHDDQSVTFKVGDTKTFSYKIIESLTSRSYDIACEEYVQEVLEISESGNPTSTSNLMIDSRSPSFTPFGGSDFLMEEIDAFLEHDDSIPLGVDCNYDS
ncbi:hypothetical protein Tco_1262133 [Tanacetum coccineum]